MLQIRFTFRNRVYLITLGHNSPWGSGQLDKVSIIREEWTNREVTFAWIVWSSGRWNRIA